MGPRPPIYTPTLKSHGYKLHERIGPWIQDESALAWQVYHEAMDAQRVARNYAKAAKRSLRQAQQLKEALQNQTEFETS